MKLILLLSIIFISSCAKDSQYRKDVKAEKLKLCFIGDTGTASEVQGKVAEKLSEEKCHSIHFLGDIIYPNGLISEKDKQFDEKFWKYYGPIAKKDNRPVLYMIMGNHDHRRSITHWVTLSKKHPEIFFPNPYYLVKMNDICLVHLDTNFYRVLSNFFVGVAQINWMDKIEEEVSACKLKFAITHHPHKNSGKSHGPSSGWLRNFLKNNVIGRFDYLISGHEHHLSDEGIKDGTHMLISGAGGKTKKIEDGGYLVFEIENGKARYEFRRLTK